jgi:alanine racemase
MAASPPLRLTLDSKALVENWRWLRGRGGAAACGAAVKADGYGLGARGVVDRLAAAGCRDFFCATWAEAEALGPLPAGASLSVLHGVRADDIATALASPARPVLSTTAQIARWRDAGGGPCDVMVDTGMNRLGLTPDEARSGLLGGLAVETLMTHLACADEPGHAMNARQLGTFRALRNAVSAKRYSLANSAGILLGEDYAFDLTRPGIALYGGVPVPLGTAAIRPVAGAAGAHRPRRRAGGIRRDMDGGGARTDRGPQPRLCRRHPAHARTDAGRDRRGRAAAAGGSHIDGPDRGGCGERRCHRRRLGRDQL